MLKFFTRKQPEQRRLDPNCIGGRTVRPSYEKLEEMYEAEKQRANRLFGRLNLALHAQAKAEYELAAMKFRGICPPRDERGRFMKAQ